MNYLFVLSCLFAVCLAATYGQSSTIRTTNRATTGRTTNRATTGRPTTATANMSLYCVCSCCSGLLCKPVALGSFVDTTCTTKACKDKCKVFEPKHCDHTIMGTNDAYCTVQF